MPHPALGIDCGDSRFGIAATDPLGILAHPVETIDVRHADPIPRIAALVAQREIKTLVVGMPLRMDGTEGTAAAKARHFASQLQKHIPGVPLVFADETLTTATAAEKLRAAGKKNKTHKPVIDQAAAVEILNGWMQTLPDNPRGG